jgi:methyl-accepting chemotaxis protein
VDYINSRSDAVASSIQEISSAIEHLTEVATALATNILELGGRVIELGATATANSGHADCVASSLAQLSKMASDSRHAVAGIVNTSKQLEALARHSDGN